MTNPYTPTTEEVRASYRKSESSLGGSPKSEWTHPRELHAEFDRWLAAHDAQVRAEVIDWFEKSMNVPWQDIDAARTQFILPVATPTTGTEGDHEHRWVAAYDDSGASWSECACGAVPEPTEAEEPEPEFDGTDDFYDRHHQWALWTGHGYGGDSRDEAVPEPTGDPQPWELYRRQPGGRLDLIWRVGSVTDGDRVNYLAKRAPRPEYGVTPTPKLPRTESGENRV